MKQPFEGLKAVGFIYAGVGGMILKVLAEFGATVVIVESMNRPSNIRLAGPFKDDVVGINRSGWFAGGNNDKYSIALNLKHPKSSEVSKRLLLWADVVVDNFSPRAMKGLGLSYEDIRKVNPNIVMISCTFQGQTGPYSHMAGYGPQMQCLTGFAELTGWPDREPDLVCMAYPDHIAPRFALCALIAALDYRKRTGKGQYIDLSEYEATIQFLSPVILDYTANRRMQTRNGNKLPFAAPNGVYRCKGEDRWCAITISTDAEWEAFCKVIGNPAWTKEEKFATILGRKKNEDELNQLVEEWTVGYAPEDVMAMIQQSGIAAGVVRNCEEVLDNCPQLKHRNYWWMLKHPEIGEYKVRSSNFKLTKTPGQLRMAAPCLGEHTEYVCTGLLDMTEEEFIDLYNDNVFE